MSDSRELVSCMCSAINTPLSLGLFLRLKYGVELSTLVSRSPLSYLDCESYAADAQVHALVKKCKDLRNNASALRDKAFEKWLLAEKQCFATNRRFYHYLDTGFFPGENQCFFHTFVEDVRRIMAEALGPCPHNLRGAFGPGRTVLIKRAVSIEEKFSQSPEMTAAAWVHVRSEMPGLWSHAVAGELFSPDHPVVDLPIVKGNVWGSVPKNSQTDRSIGFEPSFNLFIQKGIGSLLKARLCRVGLLDQRSRSAVYKNGHLYRGRAARLAQDHHRQLAKAASVDGSLATIDLSSASDTVASAVVESLLPASWFSLLSSVRSPCTDVNGRFYWLEKFSSMGNAFTFELETLIFYSLCKAVAKHCDVSLDTDKNFGVFGDDIIVPVKMARPLLAVLKFFGFTPNAEKTFTEGPFRESCGGDFYAGCDVRPIFYERAPRNPPEVFALCNKLWKVRHRFPGFLGIRQRLIDSLPVQLRAVVGSEALGDSVLHSDDLPFRKHRDGIPYQRVLVTQPVTFPRERWGSVNCIGAAAIYKPEGERSLTVRDLKSEIVARCEVFSFRVKCLEKRISFHNAAISGYVVRWTPTV